MCGIGNFFKRILLHELGDEIPNDEETKQLLAKWNMLSLMEKKVIFDVINIVIDDENSKQKILITVIEVLFFIRIQDFLGYVGMAPHHEYFAYL